MQRRTVLVHVRPENPTPSSNSTDAVCGNAYLGETHNFVGRVFSQDGGKMPEDRWYVLDDVQAYFRNVYGRQVNELADLSRPWQTLVRRYNTTLQGLSYHVRDMNVLPDTLFVDADTLRRTTTREFV